MEGIERACSKCGRDTKRASLATRCR